MDLSDKKSEAGSGGDKGEDEGKSEVASGNGAGDDRGSVAGGEAGGAGEARPEMDKKSEAGSAGDKAEEESASEAAGDDDVGDDEASGSGRETGAPEACRSMDVESPASEEASVPLVIDDTLLRPQVGAGAGEPDYAPRPSLRPTAPTPRLEARTRTSGDGAGLESSRPRGVVCRLAPPPRAARPESEVRTVRPRQLRVRSTRARSRRWRPRRAGGVGVRTRRRQTSLSSTGAPADRRGRGPPRPNARRGRRGSARVAADGRGHAADQARERRTGPRAPGATRLGPRARRPPHARRGSRRCDASSVGSRQGRKRVTVSHLSLFKAPVISRVYRLDLRVPTHMSWTESSS